VGKTVIYIIARRTSIDAISQSVYFINKNICANCINKM